MKRITMNLFTNDETYAQYFIRYNRQLTNENRYTLKVYTDKEKFAQAISNQKMDILLTDETDIDFAKGNFNEIVFLMGQDIEKDNTIYKFRPINTIISQSLAIYYENNGAPKNEKGAVNEEKVITFLSGSGGEGKTILSLCLAKCLAQYNKNVLYLNLETHHTMDLYFANKEQSSIELFYYLKNNVDKLVAKIEGLKSTDSQTNIDYVYYPVSPDEIGMLSNENIDDLIEAIKRTNNYDYIIVDTDAKIDEKCEHLLSITNEVFWILESTEKSFHHTQFLLEKQLKWDRNSQNIPIHFILNKKKDVMFPSYNSYNFSIEEKIDYQKNWDLLDEVDKLQIDSEIGRRLYQIIQDEQHFVVEV